MELAYIWIKEYGPLNKIGINFNNSINSTFEYNGKKLSVNSKQKNILNFGDKITGVSVIAGQNGSGKSSLCESVLYSIATIQEGIFGYDLPFDGIVCYGKYIFYHKDLTLNNVDELKSLGYFAKSYEQSPFEDIEHGLKREFTSGAFIYYSNSFDFRTAFHGINLLNISSANCLMESYNLSSYPVNVQQKDRISSIRKYRVLEANKILDFFLETNYKLPFSYPKSVILLSSYSGNNRSIQDDGDFRVFNDFENEIFDELCNRYYSIDDRDFEINIDREDIKKILFKLYKLNILRLINESYKFSIENARRIVFNFEGVATLEKVNTINKIKISRLFKFYKTFLDNSLIPAEYNFNPFSVMNFYKDHYRDWRFALLEKVPFDLSKENMEMLRGMINLEMELLNKEDSGIIRVTNFQMTNFYSSGELSYLSLFSRINDAINKYTKGRYLKDTIILLIDEGDVGFHPSWSKKFLKWLIDFLNNRNDGLKFQLLISTHSPYLLSDVHNENLILLKRERGSNTKIVDSSNFLTFGANIYDLLADGFFLDDGAIGDFAKNKINFAIQKINTWLDLKKEGFDKNKAHLLNDKNNEVFDIINLIGDNIVRNKLFELYFQIFEDKSSTNKEIEYLEARLRILKGGEL